MQRALGTARVRSGVVQEQHVYGGRLKLYTITNSLNLEKKCSINFIKHKLYILIIIIYVEIYKSHNLMYYNVNYYQCTIVFPNLKQL